MEFVDKKIEAHVSFVQPKEEKQTDPGMGSCTTVDCNCKSYKGSGATCEGANCGHAKSMHVGGSASFEDPLSIFIKN
jgi:hypothetical protein